MQAASDGCGASQKAQEIVEEAAAEAGLIQGDTARLVKVQIGLRSFCLYPDDCVHTHILQVQLAMHALRGWVQQQISVCSCLLRSWGPFWMRSWAKWLRARRSAMCCSWHPKSSGRLLHDWLVCMLPLGAAQKDFEHNSF